MFEITLKNLDKILYFEDKYKVYDFFNFCKTLQEEDLENIKDEIIKFLNKHLLENNTNNSVNNILNASNLYINYNGVINNCPVICINFKNCELDLNNIFNNSNNIKNFRIFDKEIEVYSIDNSNNYIIIQLFEKCDNINKVDSIYNGECPSIPKDIIILNSNKNISQIKNCNMIFKG